MSDVLIEGAIIELARNLALEKFPETHKDDPVKTPSIEERVTKLALPCSQIDEYIKYHHRTFIQQLMETKAETCIRALG